ncbi:MULTISPECIES: branched-chain amino acid ABC transporter permease [Chelativorans]|jgi:branched-chain amino acid transport system permease protein|uniref:Amino acid/amide ABC transporter membrane protein 1, HAAT family n=1 Tax=Chelativorans sp. (strain BNC1) TaxID=266779 RepID=Q11L43_CHESB|nr:MULTISPECIES: branched-chain amino acid ABC transporter permease [Chelativorans]
MGFMTLLTAGLAHGGLYALVALGLVLIYKTQGIVNWAHGELLMVGAFSGYTAFVLVGLPYPLAFLIAVLAGALLGAVMERVAFRGIVHEHHATLALVAIGFSVIIKGLARIPFGADVYTLPPAVDAGPLRFAGAIVTAQSVLTITISVGIALMLLAIFRYTRTGRQMQATQQNLNGARIVGVNTGRIFSITWALAAAVGAVAGLLAGPTSLLYPDMGSEFLLKGFAAAVLGGFYSVTGAIVGGLLVGVIEMLIGGYISTAFQQVSPFLIIIIVLFVRPHGLFGRRPVERV